MMANKPILRVENVCLRRGGREVLNGLSLEVSAGQVHTLLGLNGAGKSSLAYTLMGCEGYTPDSGQIIFDGQEISNLSIPERARLGISLAWQEPARFEGIPVGKYVSLGLKEPSREKVLAALDAVALPGKIYGIRSADSTLSGGERKRVELAAVYAMRPRLAILDEPDSGVDVLSLGDVQCLIRRLAAEGSAVLLITHREEMASIADMASIMCAGTVVFTGAPLEASMYFATRCRPHLESLGSQPWNPKDPKVLEAFLSNGYFSKANLPSSQAVPKEGQS